MTPAEAAAFVQQELSREIIMEPSNLEEQAVKMIGRRLYDAFIKGYTTKQWGKHPRDLPAAIFSRLPIRFCYNNDYFSDPWQGIPLNGYGRLFDRMLSTPGIELHTETDYFRVRDSLPKHSCLVYTGPIDRFLDYSYGRLEWRSVRFEREIHDIDDYQGTAVMNYVDPDIPFTRIHEFKHYQPERARGTKTVIYREYAEATSMDGDPYYPVNTHRKNRNCSSSTRLSVRQSTRTFFLAGVLVHTLTLTWMMP